MPNSWHDSAVGSGLFCYVAICLLGVGHMDTGVIQNPRYLVKGSGETVVLSCDPIKGHLYIFWYQQLLNKELKFLTYRNKDQILDKSGMPEKRYTSEWSSLKIHPTEPGDSAHFFCASSLDTELQIQLFSIHKHTLLRRKEGDVGESREELVSGSRVFVEVGK
uniref:Immunoglobulin domain-containing protein n=1 Tax=Monodelphis domestica TaxID=13616 RepID=K7DZA8_MONDO